MLWQVAPAPVYPASHLPDDVGGPSDDAFSAEDFSDAGADTPPAPPPLPALQVNKACCMFKFHRPCHWRVHLTAE